MTACRVYATRFFVASLMALLCAGCQGHASESSLAGSPPVYGTPSGAGSSSRTHPPPATETSTPTPPPRRTPRPVVLLVSVDGLNPEALSVLGADRLPGFGLLASQGASTLNARTAVEATVTLPNHTSMLTGRTILGPEGFSVMFNEDSGGTLAEEHGAYVPGIFDVVHDHGLGTALFAEKDKFAFLLRSWDDTHGAVDSEGADDGADKIDDGVIAPARELLPDVLGALDRHEAMVFLHVAAPDAAGHSDGFLSDGYLSAVLEADRAIGTNLRFVTERPVLRRAVTVIVTADHGGRGTSHADAALLDNYRIPFFVWGRGVRPGTDLYALNPDRRDPGAVQPGYAGPQPIRNRDAASLSLSLLGLPPLPGSTTPLQVR